MPWSTSARSRTVEDVLGEPEALLEFAEAAKAQQRVADDQERPPVADRIQRARDRAFGILKTVRFTMAISLADRTLAIADHGVV